MSREPRTLTPDEMALKVTTAALIEACGGPVACATVLDCAQSLISAYGSQTYPDRFMPIAIVMRLERLCGRPIVSRWLADRHRTEAPDKLPLAIDDVARIAIESGEACAAIRDALADGRIDAADRLRIRREIVEAQAVFSDILIKVEQP